MGTIRITRGNALDNAIRDIQAINLKVGFFQSAHYPDGTQVAEVAATQEFGDAAKHIPPRSFMRVTADERITPWKILFTAGFRSVANGIRTIPEVYNGVGLQVQGDIQRTISNIWSPPLAPATIAARIRKARGGYDTTSITKPLVDTSLMINSVSFVVNSKSTDGEV